jgi:hypothetical protein
MLAFITYWEQYLIASFLAEEIMPPEDTSKPELPLSKGNEKKEDTSSLPHNETITDSRISKDAISQYFSTEMQSITQRAIQYETMYLNKINFYLVIVTAAIGGLILSAGISEIKAILLPISCLVLFFLFITGWVTLIQGLDLSANSTLMYRRLGRIRQWFLDQEPNLYLYLPFTPGDDRPKFYAQYERTRSVESILLIVNAILASMFFVLLWFIICFQGFQLFSSSSILPFGIGLVIGITVFGAVWSVEFKYIKRYLHERERIEKQGWHIHFPAKETEEKFSNLSQTK